MTLEGGGGKGYPKYDEVREAASHMESSVSSRGVEYFPKRK